MQRIANRKGQERYCRMLSVGQRRFLQERCNKKRTFMVRQHGQIIATLWGFMRRNCTVTVHILSALWKMPQCDLHHVPLPWSDSAAKIFNEIWFGRHLSSKEELTNILFSSRSQAFSWISGRSCCWCDCSDLACVCFFPHPSIAKDKVVLAWFNDHTGLIMFDRPTFSLPK